MELWTFVHNIFNVLYNKLLYCYLNSFYINCNQNYFLLNQYLW